MYALQPASQCRAMEPGQGVPRTVQQAGLLLTGENRLDTTA